MRHWPPLIPLLITVLAACGEEARISVSALLDPPLAAEMLTVTIRDVNRLIRFTGADFKSDPRNLIPTTPEVGTATSGPDLEFSYILRTPEAVVSTGTVSIPRRSDWRWNVTVSADTTNPEESCFGCFGSRAFPLAESFRASERDSIWVVWGGNSISNPAIY